METTPARTETTGIGKRCRNERRHAVRKQHAGMLAAPASRVRDAISIWAAGRGG
jgi:hypothetical protein